MTPGPPRILLATMGTRGDHEPFLALASALRSLGCDTTLAGDGRYAAPCSAAAARFAPLYTTTEPQWRSVRAAIRSSVTPAGRHHAYVQEFLRPNSPVDREVLEALAADHDLVVANQGIGEIIAGWSSPEMTSLQRAAGGKTVLLQLHPWSPAALKRLAPVALRTFAAAPAALVGARAFGRPEGAQALGFLRQPWRGRPSMPFELLRWLKNHPEPVVVASGSLGWPEGIVGGVTAAARALGRGVILIGAQDPSAAGPGSDVYAAEDLCHDEIFPFAGCIVHHAGAGVTAAVLRHRRRSIAVPLMFDQHYWADILVRHAGGRLADADGDLSPTSWMERLSGSLATEPDWSEVESWHIHDEEGANRKGAETVLRSAAAAYEHLDRSGFAAPALDGSR